MMDEMMDENCLFQMDLDWWKFMTHLSSDLFSNLALPLEMKFLHQHRRKSPINNWMYRNCYRFTSLYIQDWWKNLVINQKSSLETRWTLQKIERMLQICVLEDVSSIKNKCPTLRSASGLAARVSLYSIKMYVWMTKVTKPNDNLGCSSISINITSTKD